MTETQKTIIRTTIDERTGEERQAEAFVCGDTIAWVLGPDADCSQGVAREVGDALTEIYEDLGYAVTSTVADYAASGCTPETDDWRETADDVFAAFNAAVAAGGVEGVNGGNR